MTRKTSAKGKDAQDAARKCSQECFALARSGKLHRASKELFERVSEWLERTKLGGRALSRGQAGEAEFRRVAIELLALCVEYHVPPPNRLQDALAILLNVKPIGLGNYWALVAFAARYDKMEDVPTRKLTKAGLLDVEGITFTAHFNKSSPPPLGSFKAAEPIINENQARALKSCPEFHHHCREAKALGTDAYRAKWEKARLVARTEAAKEAIKFEGLQNIVRRVARRVKA